MVTHPVNQAQDQSLPKEVKMLPSLSEIIRQFTLMLAPVPDLNLGLGHAVTRVCKVSKHSLFSFQFPMHKYMLFTFFFFLFFFFVNFEMVIG